MGTPTWFSGYVTVGESGAHPIIGGNGEGAIRKVSVREAVQLHSTIPIHDRESHVREEEGKRRWGERETWDDIRLNQGQSTQGHVRTMEGSVKVQRGGAMGRPILN